MSLADQIEDLYYDLPEEPSDDQIREANRELRRLLRGVNVDELPAPDRQRIHAAAEMLGMTEEAVDYLEDTVGHQL